MTLRPAFTCRSISSVKAPSFSANNLVITGERLEFKTDPFAAQATEYKQEVGRCLIEAFDLREERLTRHSEITF
jgi:hypothetical protein